MKKIIKQIVIVVLILGIIIMAISFFRESENQNAPYESGTISERQADVLQFDSTKITNLSNRSAEGATSSTIIKNISSLNISELNIYYKELDKKEQEVFKSIISLDNTLKPEDTMEIVFTPKDFTNTIEIVSYSYISDDCLAYINIEDNTVSLSENDKYLANSRSYEVISVKNLGNIELLQNECSYMIEIENISEKNLGNIVLKVGEINSEGHYVGVNHITFNSILEPEQRAEIIGSLSEPGFESVILGYTYDDIGSKSNVDIDLVTHKANIIDNKK